ncbi:hypothetical protein, partial [Sphingomonas fennica]|uniref:hypothetical protein n=1 Tax=Edaphosphingomonas fennica TaxID=114404 RepID=UPI001B862144
DQTRQPILPAIIVAAQPAIVVVAAQHGLSRLPAGPGGGDPGAAGRIISAGKAETDDARAAAQSMRGQRVQGNVDLQGEVNQGLDHDFFRDPKLRQ